MKAFTAALWASSVPSPVTCATQNKAKTIPSLAPWNTMLNFTAHPALFLELLSLLDLLCPMTSFAFQMNSVYSAMQWSPDSAKCFGPCLILSPQIALLVLSVCRGCTSEDTAEKWSKNFGQLQKYLQKMTKTHQCLKGTEEERIHVLTELTVLWESPEFPDLGGC